MAVIVISFDGVTDTQFEKMANQPDLYPNIAKFKSEAIYRNGIKSIFVTNTYPIHTTIATGKLPSEHGVISNFVETDKGRIWAQLANLIKSETIWDVARKKGLTVASILWPVTCGADIKWNMPEVHIYGNENQVIQNLKYGSKIFQLQAFLKHGKNLKGIEPISLDDFTTSVACDLLKKKKPDLTLIHLLAFDSFSHMFGGQSGEIDEAKKSLDASLGRILEAANQMPEATIIAFSDHGHFDAFEMVNLCEIFGENVYEQCGGSAFLNPKQFSDGESFSLIKSGIEIENLAQFENFPWFERFLTEQEMIESGYASVATHGIAAKKGYCFSDEKQHKSNHGYPVDYEDYNVFYAIREGAEYIKTAHEIETKYGDVRDITELIKQILGLKM